MLLALGLPLLALASSGSASSGSASPAIAPPVIAPPVISSPVAPRPGEIPHLARGEWIVVTESGGHLGHEGRLTIRTDGTANYVSRRMGGPPQTFGWRLTGTETRELRRLVDATDFPALHRAPRAQYPPSAVDGRDRGLAVRRRDGVRGWTNTIWTAPETPVPLFARLDALTARGFRETGNG